MELLGENRRKMESNIIGFFSKSKNINWGLFAFCSVFFVYLTPCH